MATSKSIPFFNCNLYLKGFGIDTNGNSVVRLSFPNNGGFSIQTNGVLRETQYIGDRKGKKLNTITVEELRTIEKEVVNYVKKYGSALQKKRLKTY